MLNDDLSNKEKIRQNRNETRRTLNLISSRQNVKFDRKHFVCRKTKSPTKNRSKAEPILFFFLVLHIDKGKQEIHVYV